MEALRHRPLARRNPTMRHFSETSAYPPRTPALLPHFPTFPSLGFSSREATYPSQARVKTPEKLATRLGDPVCHSHELRAMYPIHRQTESSEPIQSETSPASASSQLKRTNGLSPTDPSGEGRKVHRVSRACDYCKSKKTRCSGTRPCDSCTKRRIVCEYDTQYSRGRPPTPPVGRESLVRAGDAGSGGDGRAR